MESVMVNPKRDGVVGIHSACQFCFSVPDLSVAEKYYGEFGLKVEKQGDRIALSTFHSPHTWGYVLDGRGGKKQLEYLTLGAYPEDLEALRLQALANGATLANPHSRAISEEGFWIRDLDGNLLQVAVRDKVTPNDKPESQSILYKKNSVNVPIAFARGETPQVKPLRLSHILLFTTDVGRSVEFYSSALGLRLSDKSADIVAFTHGPHSSDHHLLAFLKSTAPGLHHTSWAVANLDEVGLGMEQMFAAGHKEGWGVGRHVIGSNYFYYVRDPWGSFTEYSYDIDFIGVDTNWPAADYSPESSLYLWGPGVPEYFGENTEA
jgi:catechol 2,3-dioxygenase-like lactoylglutathione lyase family enzyme